MKQTAVEWFEQQLDNSNIEIPFSIFEQAKEMERQQIVDAWENGYNDGYIDNGKDGKQYYNEILKKDEIRKVRTTNNFQ